MNRNLSSRYRLLFQKAGSARWHNWLNRWLKLRNNRALHWLVTIGLLFFAAFAIHRLYGDWELLRQTEIHFQVGFIFLAIGLYGINFAFFIVVWQGIVHAIGGSSSWQKNAQVYCYTYLAKLLPTPAWFLAGRLYYSKQIGLENTYSLYATGIELGLHILMALLFYGVLYLIQSQSWLCLAVLVLGMVLLWRLNWPKRLRRVGFLISVHLKQSDIALWSFLYLLTWILAGPYLQAIVRAFVPTTISVWSAWRIWTLASIASYVGFLLMGGMGFFREISISVLLAEYLRPGDALIIAIGTRLIMVISGVLWALFAILIIRFLAVFNFSEHSEGSQ